MKSFVEEKKELCRESDEQQEEQYLTRVEVGSD